MGEQQIHAPGLRRHVVLQHAAVRIVHLGLAQQTLEVADIAVDRAAEVGIALVAAGDLVEGDLAVTAIEMTAEDAPLARTVALPHLGSRMVIERPSDFVEPQVR